MVDRGIIAVEINDYATRTPTNVRDRPINLDKRDTGTNARQDSRRCLRPSRTRECPMFDAATILQILVSVARHTVMLMTPEPGNRPLPVEDRCPLSTSACATLS